MDRTSLSCAWLGLPTSRFRTREAPHNQIYDPGGSPQADLRPGKLPQISVCNPRGSPRGLPLGFQTEIYFKPRASPQEELRLGRLPTSRVTDTALNGTNRCPEPRARWQTRMASGTRALVLECTKKSKDSLQQPIYAQLKAEKHEEQMRAAIGMAGKMRPAAAWVPPPTGQREKAPSMSRSRTSHQAPRPAACIERAARHMSSTHRLQK